MTTNDYSQAFQSLMDAPNSHLNQSELNTIRDGFVLVFVRGFLGNLGALLPGGYFSHYQGWLKRNRINTYIIDKKDHFDTEKAPDLNVEAIKQVVQTITAQQTAKKILFISHSKGGIDLLTALIETAELIDHCGGWIAIQAPFEGTKLANLATFSFINRTLIGKLLKKLGGSENSLNTLRTDFRKEYLQNNVDNIINLVQDMPVLTFGSSYSSPGRNPFTRVFQLQGEENDGIVPMQSTRLTNNGTALCPFIFADSIFHTETVIRNNLLANNKPRIKPLRFLQVMLKLWLQSR